MKRIFSLALPSLLLLAVILSSLLVVPSRFQNRFRPIPAYAQLVYNNKKADGFLSFFPFDSACGVAPGRHPLGTPLPLVGNDGAGGAICAVLQSVGLQAVGKRPLAVATGLFGVPPGHAAWVAVSELGGPASLALRWRLLLFPPNGVESARSYAAWPVWTLELPSLPPWARVRFTVTDGLLICSISADSHDIYKLIDTLDGRVASMADQRSRELE